MADKKIILVTGATGFIGSRALGPLRALGFEVHAAARTVPAASPDGVAWHAVDLLDHGAARALVATLRPTHLLHFAWYAEHGKFWSSPLNLDWLGATMALLRAFAEAGGRRFVGAGTCAEYDWNDPASQGICDEATTPLKPANLYGAAKASAFLTGEAFAKVAGVEFAWGRIFHLFGPGEAPARIVPALIRAHLASAPLECGPGDTVRDFLPAASVAHAFAHLSLSSATGAVNIGSGETRSFADLSAEIAVLSGARGEIRFGAYADAGPKRLVPSVEKLRSTGWIVPASTTEGLRESVEAIRAAERHS